MEQINAFAPTPQQLVNFLAAVATINFIDEGQTRLSRKILDGDIERAWDHLAVTADDFIKGGERRDTFIKLITSVGVTKLIIAIMAALLKSLTELGK